MMKKNLSTRPRNSTKSKWDKVKEIIPGAL